MATATVGHPVARNVWVACASLNPCASPFPLCCNQAPASKRKVAGNLEFAVRGGIDDLHAAWAELKPRLALTYPFELDTFQKEAVLHLENGRSVSAGHDTYLHQLILSSVKLLTCLPQ